MAIAAVTLLGNVKDLRASGPLRLLLAAASVGCRLRSANGGSDRQASASSVWQVGSQRACQGFEQEWVPCDGLVSCGSCVPTDCHFTAWTDWYYAGGCIGLCLRHRSIDVENNECGRLCSGTKMDTKECPQKKSCLRDLRDCQVGNWEEWTECASAQRYRERRIIQQPVSGGQACHASLQETAPCGDTAYRACRMGAWASWTACSVSCGGGWYSRKRRIAAKAIGGGQQCQGSLRQMQECGVSPCPGKQCTLTPWSEWRGCDSKNPAQRYRGRYVLDAAQGDNACREPTREVRACTERPHTRNCQLSQWSEWSSCDKQCGSGQTFRSRGVVALPRLGGGCEDGALKEIGICNAVPCEGGAGDCRLQPWTSWSSCSSTQCGSGVRSRHRAVLQPATHGGKSCEGAMQEVGECVIEDDTCGASVDCKWRAWAEWGMCTCTCGGGSKRRYRVVETAPAHGGRACEPLDKEQIVPCNVISCEKGCVDAEWATWSQWTACSATCDVGFSWRLRDLGRQANDCGRAVVGNKEQFRICTAAQSCSPDRDCQLSPWNAWSSCSCSCDGVRERGRSIVQFHTGRGKPCVTALREIEPCSPSVNQQRPPGCALPVPLDCLISPWEPWSLCSATCGGGQQIRSRQIQRPPAHNGATCQQSLKETSSCGIASCPAPHCVSCRWGPWSDWGSCSKCGDQTFRQRDIQQLPNSCGQRCDPGDSKEVATCTSSCLHLFYCGWTSWADAGTCSTSCGPGTQIRQRSLQPSKPLYEDGYLFKAVEGATCSGSQIRVVACRGTTPCTSGCTPIDCEFDEWSLWQQPTCLGLCNRARRIKTVNNECGTPCKGTLVQTKRCKANCTKSVDCLLSAWGAWQSCGDRVASQSIRERRVLQNPANGGLPCVGALQQVTSCETAPPEMVDCSLEAWSLWGACSQTCGSGIQKRTRTAHKASGDGQVCSLAPLAAFRFCSSEPCRDVDCALGGWSFWSACSSNSQQHRARKIVTHVSGRGQPCIGLLGETRSCVNSAVDCIVSDWTEWDPCDEFCGRGQRSRHRQVVSYPTNGGKPCSGTLAETEGCYGDGGPQCDTLDCEVSKWSEWNYCTTTCGAGQQNRQRNIEVMARGGGDACVLALSETRSCPSNPPCDLSVCLWSDWRDWSDCSCSCGGGHRSRSRHIAQAPKAGDARCKAVPKEEVQPCGTQSCQDDLICVDGLWTNWDEWEPCSRTCQGGLTWRSRQVAREASECGRLALGLSREEATCNMNIRCSNDVNCLLGSWSAWSSCSQPCDGVKRRSRRIKVSGQGRGAFCNDATKETAPCNPEKGNLLPEGCETVNPSDCVLSDWGPWSKCTHSCDGGQKGREREITSVARNGGKGCTGAIEVTADCNSMACEGDVFAVDCQWGDWSDWGACSKCSGQRLRYRRIVTHSRYGGKACDSAASQETTQCERQCHKVYSCAWQPWVSFTDCSITCGTGGRRSRVRRLALVDATQIAARQTARGADLQSGSKLLQQVEEKPKFAFVDPKPTWKSFLNDSGQVRLELLLACASGYFLTLVIPIVRTRLASVAVSLRSGVSSTYLPIPTQEPIVEDGASQPLFLEVERGDEVPRNV